MIKVLHKAFNILEYLSACPEGQTLTNIAAHIGEKTTTASNIVQVLAKRNYLERVDGRWKLGVSAYLLTGSTMDYDRALCTMAEPILRELAAATETTVVLSVWRGQRFVLLRIADKSAVTVNRSYPEATEVYRTATGMMLLAEQPEKVVNSYIAANGIPGIESPSEKAVESFRAALSLCHEKGFYIREKESIFEAAAPIRDPGGQARTAIGIFLPLFRVTDREKLITLLLKATCTLEHLLSETMEQ